MKNHITIVLFSIAFLIGGVHNVQAQDGRKNAILLSGSYTKAHGLGVDLGIERQIWKRSFISSSIYSNFNTTCEMDAAYKIRFLKLWRVSLLGGVKVNYTISDHSQFNPEITGYSRSLSWNPLLETRLRITNKVDLSASYNFKSRELWSSSNNLVQPYDRGWRLGARIKF